MLGIYALDGDILKFRGKLSGGKSMLVCGDGLRLLIRKRVKK
ncbi:MAG: hypothetical protein ACYC3I_14375 [Gemmataceae bacterium]